MRGFHRGLIVILCICTLSLGLKIDRLNKGMIVVSREKSSIIEYNKELESELVTAKDNIKKLEDENELLQITTQRLTDEVTNLKKQRSNEVSSRSTTKKVTTMNVSAYTLAKNECGKSQDHPLYGITASGKRVKEWHTIATGGSIPFGTRVYIPYFKDYPNNGIFVVQDRGGAITDRHIDVYMKDINDANTFGRRNLEVHILDNPANM